MSDLERRIAALETRMGDLLNEERSNGKTLRDILSALTAQQMPALETIRAELAEINEAMSSEPDDSLAEAVRDLHGEVSALPAKMREAAEDTAIRAVTLATGGGVSPPRC